MIAESESRAAPVRILFLADRYETSRAGTEIQLRALIAGLDRSRFEPGIALLRGDAREARRALRCAVDVVGIRRLRSARSAVALLRYALSARRRGFRLVHCFFNDASLAAPLFRCAGLRVVVSRRDMGFWYTPAILRALRFARPFVDRYVANSRAVRELVACNERVAPERIHVIRNGCCDADRRADAGVEPSGDDLRGRFSDAAIVGMVANLRPVKRVETLIEALGLLRERRPDFRVVVIGADASDEFGASVRERLLELARRYLVGERVVFVGSLADPAPLVRRFAVAVLCSESEGLSNALIEYMQAARPIVCTDTGGNPELIDDGVNGYLVPVGDAPVLADRIERLLGDRALADRLGKAARESALRHCGVERMLAEQMACYEQVLAARVRTVRGFDAGNSANGMNRC